MLAGVSFPVCAYRAWTSASVDWNVTSAFLFNIMVAKNK